jgi:CubicO group peptidase (beta-lactamase class C family)
MRFARCLFPVLLLTPVLVPAQSQREIIARIEQNLTPPVAVEGVRAVRWTLAERMIQHHAPGISVAVMRGRKIAWARGYGLLEAGKSEQVNADTLFQAASVSKPVAAVAALRLGERGVLQLDEDVNEKLKSWKLPENDFTRTEKVTLRRILSHSAGLTVHGFRGYADGEAIPTLVQILDGTKPANSAPVRVDVTSGSIWRYSGGGFTVMQQLMIDITGNAFPALMRALVLEPVGMKRSTFEQPLPEAFRTNAARGHRSDGGVVKGLWHAYPEMAAAGLWTTPTDLAMFAIELREEALGRSTKLLSPEMAKAMLTLQKQDYGLGVRIQGEGNRMRFSHGGANEGYRCFFVMYEESGDGAAIMTNGDSGDQLFLELLRSIATEYNWPDFLQQHKTAVPVAPEVLKQYEGVFDLQGDQFRFAVEDGSLWLHLSWRPKVKLFAESATRFFATEDNIPAITFVRDEAGKVDQIEMMDRKARRVK